VEFDILFGRGIVLEGELIDLGVAIGQVRKMGSWYAMGEDRMGQGRENAIAWLKERPAMKDKLVQAIRSSSNLPLTEAVSAEADESE
jgi:recombination protein RecA